MLSLFIISLIFVLCCQSIDWTLNTLWLWNINLKFNKCNNDFWYSYKCPFQKCLMDIAVADYKLVVCINMTLHYVWVCEEYDLLVSSVSNFKHEKIIWNIQAKCAYLNNSVIYMFIEWILSRFYNLNIPLYGFLKLNISELLCLPTRPLQNAISVM